MCRLAAYLGDPLLAADLITRPARSIIQQSFDARQRLGGDGGEVYNVGALNADGFGLGWYVNSQQDEKHSTSNTEESFSCSSCPSPCVITDTGPAWNNRNLNMLAPKVKSGIIFAHVRAAGPGMGVCQCSCHPFYYGRYMFMHNGQVGNFSKVRRFLLSDLSDAAFTFAIQNSCSDSAVAFALLLMR